MKERQRQTKVDNIPLTEHLVELRKRIVISLSAVIIVFGLCFYYSEYIFHILTLPIPEKLDLNLVFLAPAEALWVHLKIALISALVISSPVIFYEFWKFVAPGLLIKEKKYALPFVITTTFLFLIGALFCFIIVLPFAMDFLLTYKTETVKLKPMLSVGKYINFCLKFIISFGVIFELPVVLVFLTRMGIVTPKSLAKNRKYAILLAFVVAAFLTPTPDAFNQTLMALPIVVLYEAGIWASRILNVKQKGKDNNKIGGGE